MGIDPSIPLRAGQGVQPMANPLVMANQIMQFKTGQQNLLNQQSTAAANGDMQQAIDPATGKLDPLKYNQLLAADPRAARSMQASSQAGASNAQTTIANTGALQQQAFQRFTVTGNALGSLLATGKPITPKDVTNVVGDLVASPDHPMNAQEGAQLIAQAHGMNPDQLTQAVRARYAFAQQSAAALAAQVAMANNGQQQVPVNTNPIAGPVGQMQGNPVQNRLGPEALATQIPGQDANGQPITRALGSVLGQEGASTGAPAQPSPQQLMAQATQMANQGGPGANAPQAQAWLQQQMQARGMNPEPAGAIANGPAPGVTQAAATTAQNSATQGNALTNDMVAIPQQRAALSQIAAEINSANPGPLNEQLTKIGGVLTQLGYPSDQATGAQLMHKASALNAISSVANNLGVPTDGKMQEVMAATPNATMTPEAAKAATGMLQGLLDYKQAKGTAWQQYQAQNGPTSFPQFLQEWNKAVPNASAFQFQHLPQKEQQKYWQSLDKADKQSLLDSMKRQGTLPTSIQPQK
jgi:transposase-like protein